MQAQAIRSAVESVTVYTQGARVVRVGTITLEDTAHDSIELGGLPLSLIDDSVKLSLEATGGAPAPTAVDVRVALDVPPRDDELRPARTEELEAARRERARIEARAGQLRRELERLSGLGILERPSGADGEPPPPSPTDARLSLIEMREREARSLAAELEAEEERLEKARRHLRDLETRDRRATSARQAEEHELRKAVVARLVADGRARGGEARVVLEYQVPGARWAPAYALRMDRAMTRAELSMRAVVAQRSGEDWSGAELTVSTAEMQRFTELPELASIRIGRAQPEPPRAGWRPPPPGTDELYRDWDRAFRSRFFEPPPPRHAPPAPPPTVRAPGSASETVQSSIAEDMLDDEFEEPTGVTVAGAAEPAAEPEMAPAPPMPAHEMPPRAKSRNLLGGLFSRPSAGAPAMPGAPASFGGPPPQQEAVFKEAEQALEPVPAAPAGDLLRYGELRMPPARSSRRGKLMLASRTEVYLQLLIAQEIQVDIDVLGAVARAERAAADLDEERLPAGCRYAWSQYYDYAYPAAARVDIPSDGGFHSVPLARAAAPVERTYVVVPRESCDVFRTARMTNPLDAPLLPGPIDVYLGGDFLLTSDVDFTAARGEVELGLGVEQGIKVARNVRYREESAGLMGGSLELHHQILVDVRNNLDQNVPLEVRERLPSVREDDEDEIRLIEGKVSPPWEPWEQRPDGPAVEELDNGRRWRVDLAPGAAEDLRAEYAIRLSSKHELVGGNRREA